MADENEKDIYLILRSLQSSEREINLLTVREWELEGQKESYDTDIYGLLQEP